MCDNTRLLCLDFNSYHKSVCDPAEEEPVNHSDLTLCSAGCLLSKKKKKNVNYKAEPSTKCWHLRKNVHVHVELLQEPCEGVGLLEVNQVPHPLPGVCIQPDAASPAQTRETEDQFKDTADI